MSDVRRAEKRYVPSASCLYDWPLRKPGTLGLHCLWLAECPSVRRAEKRYVPLRAVRILSLLLASPKTRNAWITVSLARQVSECPTCRETIRATPLRAVRILSLRRASPQTRNP